MTSIHSNSPNWMVFAAPTQGTIKNLGADLLLGHNLESISCKSVSGQQSQPPLWHKFEVSNHFSHSTSTKYEMIRNFFTKYYDIIVLELPQNSRRAMFPQTLWLQAKKIFFPSLRPPPSYPLPRLGSGTPLTSISASNNQITLYNVTCPSKA